MLSRRWTRPGLVLGLLLGALSGSTGSAQAGAGTCGNDYVCVSVGTAGTPPSSSGGNPGSGAGGSCSFGGKYLPCYIPGIGTLSSQDGCYYIEMQPQPPAGDPLWQGHAPGDGAVYIRTCALNAGGGTVSLWLPAPPPVPPQVTPEQLAHIAMDRVKLNTPVIRTAPNGKKPFRYESLVGVPVWMWIVQPTKVLDGQNKYGNTYAMGQEALIIKASVPGLAITAKVTTPVVTWHTGDQPPKACLGSPVEAYPGVADQACTHVYAEPKANYWVWVNVTWSVSWWSTVGPKASGTFPAGTRRSVAVPLRVDELQVLN